MANIFGILTAVVLLISAFLAWKNMGDETQEKVGYRGWITARQNMENDLARNENKLAETKQDLADTEADLGETNSRVDGLQTEVDALVAENAKLKEEEAAKKQEADDKKAQVESARQKLAEVGNAEQAIADIKKLQADIASLKLGIGEKETTVANLEGTKVSTQDTIDGVREKIRYRVTQESEPGLVTYITGAFMNLGFVTLAHGDGSGVVKDSTLNVVRGNEVIGQLLVTSVERSTAAAGVVPDSFVDGARPRVGDRVVPAMPKAPEGPPPAPGEPAPADAAPPVSVDPEG